ncbi:MAG: mandelate racemase/muconate lactonizing enzyme family protein [Candidatus Rokubacteria bacterium]|nr:mandelate racemase/muconate lactonizing enzyme family protein [Candidatus Rokubacteria bacterium]
MKIAGIETATLRVPTSKQMALEFPYHAVIVARVRTDAGIEGLGYSLAFAASGAEAIQMYLDTRLVPLLVGEDPLFVERHWERMFRVDRGIRRQGIAAYAVSALDIALWDIVGKAANLPLYKLWGAATDRIAAYGSGGWAKYSVKDVIAEAERYAGQGCRYYKMKIHDPDPRVNRERVMAVKKALGDGVRMMVDVNQKLDAHNSIRQARLLEDLDLVWYEEPVLADDIAACAEVAQAIAIPVATGENAYTRWEFRDLIERKAARYLMPDVCRANGFSETMRIGRLAAAHSTLVSPHVVHELSLHVAAALPNSFLVEYMDWAPADLFDGLPPCERGEIAVPDRPGHGIALAKGAIEKYRVR